MDKTQQAVELEGHRTSPGVVAVISANRLCSQLRARDEGRVQPLVPGTGTDWAKKNMVPFGD